MMLQYLEYYITGWATMVCIHAILSGFTPENTTHSRFLKETLLWPYYLPAAVFFFSVGFVKGLRGGLSKDDEEK